MNMLHSDPLQKKKKPLIMEKVKQKMQRNLKAVREVSCRQMHQAKYCGLSRTRKKSILDKVVSTVNFLPCLLLEDYR